MSNKIFPRLTAVAFAAALTFAGTAEAGSVSSVAGLQESPLSAAWEWMTEVWGDLTGLQSTAASESVRPDPSTTTPDVGCGIDPNGSPCGG
jgi:hypothetical protein